MCPFRHPFRKLNGMSCGIYFHIGGYHHVVTDNDIVIIEERTVLVIVEPYSLFEPIITTR